MLPLLNPGGHKIKEDYNVYLLLNSIGVLKGRSTGPFPLIISVTW
jgi:hypothetical protein